MRLAPFALGMAVFAAGCGAQISDGGANLSGADAGDGTGGGTGTGGLGDATSAPACTNRVVYLNFEGQTLTHAETSDATQNQASWMTIDQGTAPPYLDGANGRDATIQNITDGVRSILDKAQITVVTDRPSSGSYVMIVLGGAASDVGSQFGGAVNTLDCGDLIPNDVAWISDGVKPVTHVINDAVGAVGFGVGLTATSDPEDCMCGWANDCTSDNTNRCTLGSPVPRDSTATQLCPDLDPQDEVAVLHNAFCH